MATEVILPKLGQTMEEGAIVEWLKEEGDEIKRGELLFTVESDKATLESESPGRGILRKILVPAGVTVPVLTAVAIITRQPDEDISAYLEGQPAGAAPVAPPQEEVGARKASVESAAEAPVRAAGERIFASPRARMRARELSVDLAPIVGTGPGGRIVEKDVLAYVESQPRATPMARKVAADLGIELATVTGTGVGGKITREDVEAAQAVKPAAVPRVVSAPVPAPVAAAEVLATQPLSGLRRIIAERMYASVQNSAQVTLMTKVDATEFVEIRTKLKASVTEEWGFAPGYNDLLGLMVAKALREYPYVNARLSGDVIEQLAHVNLGLAVDVERGLLVPVIRDADQLGLREFGRQFRELVERARAGRSLPDDLSGGTFTITNLGMHEIDGFTPIINAPEAAILGVGRIKAEPAVKDGAVVVRQMMTLSLVFDHRIIDGAPAARFLQRVKHLVENPYLLLG